MSSGRTRWGATGQVDYRPLPEPLLQPEHVGRFVVILAALVGIAIASPTFGDEPSEAQRMTDEAFAVYKQAEAAQQGWAEIYQRGIELSRRAIALEPNLADAYYALFLNLAKLGVRKSYARQFRNLSELKGLLKKTIELDPNHAHAWEAQGEMYLQLPRLFGGSESEAEKALRRSHEIAPKWSKPVLRLAQLHQKNGNAAVAKTEAATALELAKAEGDQELAKEASELLSQVASAAH